MENPPGMPPLPKATPIFSTAPNTLAYCWSLPPPINCRSLHQQCGNYFHKDIKVVLTQLPGGLFGQQEEGIKHCERMRISFAVNEWLAAKGM